MKRHQHLLVVISAHLLGQWLVLTKKRTTMIFQVRDGVIHFFLTWSAVRILEKKSQYGCGRWAPQPQPHLVSQCLIVLMSRCPIGLVSWCPSVPVTWCPSVSVIAGGQRNTQFFGHTDRWTDGQRWYPPKNHANSDCFKNLATYYYHQVTVGHFKQQHSISDSFWIPIGSNICTSQ